jgi:hypothetical protein
MHAEVGDANIYMRGVLFAVKKRDRAAFIESLEILLGEKGTLYQLEIPSSSIHYLRGLPEDIYSQIPKITKRIGFNFEELHLFYPEDSWTIIDQGQNIAMSTLWFSTGTESEMPANYLIMRRNIGQLGQEYQNNEAGLILE